VAPGFNGNPVVEKDGNLLPELIFGFRVGNSDLCAVRLQEQGGGHPGAPKPDDKNAFVV
jgi:hypothetical protein